LMHQGDTIPLIEGSASMEDALLEMTTKGFGCVGVIEGSGDLCGIITDGDIRRHMGPNLLTKTAKNVMTSSPQTITPRSLAGEALAQMNTTGFNGITCLFVATNGKPVGILSVHDCLRNGVM